MIMIGKTLTTDSTFPMIDGTWLASRQSVSDKLNDLSCNPRGRFDTSPSYFSYFRSMRLLLAKFITGIAIAFILAHILVPHHHHDETEITQHHQDPHEHSHNILSLLQLSDSYLISNNSYSTDHFTVSLLFLLPNNCTSAAVSLSEGKSIFAIVEESPPPRKYFHSLPLRGPPTA